MLRKLFKRVCGQKGLTRREIERNLQKQGYSRSGAREIINAYERAAGINIK